MSICWRHSCAKPSRRYNPEEGASQPWRRRSHPKRGSPWNPERTAPKPRALRRRAVSLPGARTPRGPLLTSRPRSSQRIHHRLSRTKPARGRHRRRRLIPVRGLSPASTRHLRRGISPASPERKLPLASGARPPHRGHRHPIVQPNPILVLAIQAISRTLAIPHQRAPDRLCEPVPREPQLLDSSRRSRCWPKWRCHY